jgi:hypothetical protein
VSLHPNCKKDFNKESTKVDAEYNLPTWVPKTRMNMTKRRIPKVDIHVHHVSRTLSGPHHDNNQLGLCLEPAGGETVCMYLKRTSREHSGDI